MEKHTISKIGLICIRNGKLLIVYKPKIRQYITPGGKLEPCETDTECLDREILEEIGCTAQNLTYFGLFRGLDYDGNPLQQRCYLGELKGKITLNPSDTIKGYSWINQNQSKNLPLGLMLKDQIIPALVNQGLL